MVEKVVRELLSLGIKHDIIYELDFYYVN